MKMAKGDKMKESTLQQIICQYMSANGIFYFSIPNEHYNISFKQRTVLKKMGLVPGMPDLAILANNTIYFMELKVEDGVLNKHQKIIIPRLIEKGYKVAIVYSYEQAVEQLKRWGV